MQIDVKLHGVLREILPRSAKGQTQLELDDGTTVADVLSQLGIKRQVIVAINDDAESEKTQVLAPGDRLTVFSAVSGGGGHYSQNIQGVK